MAKGSGDMSQQMAGAQGTDRFKAFQDRWQNSGMAGMLANARANMNQDPTQLARVQNALRAAQNGAPIQAGTPPQNSVAPGAPLPPTSNDATMGPSYMPNQPNMTGAPVAAPAPAPATTVAKPAAKPKATTQPAAAPGKKYDTLMPQHLYGTGRNYAQMLLDNWRKGPMTDPVAFMNLKKQLEGIQPAQRYNDMGPGRR